LLFLPPGAMLDWLVLSLVIWTVDLPLVYCVWQKRQVSELEHILNIWYEIKIW
jgi:hypothetical protein